MGSRDPLREQWLYARKKFLAHMRVIEVSDDQELFSADYIIEAITVMESDDNLPDNFVTIETKEQWEELLKK